MDVLSSVALKDVQQTAEVFVLKKAMEAASNSVLTLVGDAVAAQNNNPPNLGHTIDVKV